MNTVTALGNRRDSYHHGDLRNALCDSATELARRGGPEAVVLREAARRVGVSATAAYRHFANHGELMNAVKLRALGELAVALQTAIDHDEPTGDDGADAVRSLYTAARAYIGFALSETGLFRSAFCHLDHTDPPGTPPGPDWSSRNLAELPAYGILVRLMDHLVATGRLTSARREGADVVAWSTVHGLATLLLDGPLARLGEPNRQATIDRTVDLVVTGLVAL
jgi:AcrR family transcriptional regulator